MPARQNHTKHPSHAGHHAPERCTNMRAARRQAHLQQAVQARAQLGQQHGHLGLAVQQQPAVDGHAAGAGAGLPPHLAAEQQQRQRAHHRAVAQPHLAGLHLLVEHLARGPMKLALYPVYPNPRTGAALRGRTYRPREATRRLFTERQVLASTRPLCGVPACARVCRGGAALAQTCGLAKHGRGAGAPGSASRSAPARSSRCRGAPARPPLRAARRAVCQRSDDATMITHAPAGSDTARCRELKPTPMFQPSSSSRCLPCRVDPVVCPAASPAAPPNFCKPSTPSATRRPRNICKDGAPGTSARTARPDVCKDRVRVRVG